MNNNTNTTLSPYREVEDEPGLLFVVLACALSSVWILFLGFYWSRFSGIIITHILNKFFVSKDAYIKIGSLSLSVVSGKLMFRDVLYVTRDLTFRVVDGYAIFHWWQKYIPKTDEGNDGDGKDDKQRPCRLNVSLNGFEFHIYNRSDLYDKLQDLYKKDRYGDAHKSTEIVPGTNDDNSSPVDAHGRYQWRDLIPAIKFKINTAKIAFGNKMVERTLCFHFERADAQYEVTKPSSFLDQFAHKVVCDCKNVRVMLAPTNGYTGSKEDPPRYMGEEGFVVLKSQSCKMNYIQDEPGIVPETNTENEMTIETDPTWVLDVSFLKSASISYGPWADRQREQLQKFFFPLDYQELPVNKGVGPGQRRQHSGLDIRLDFKCDSNLELLFTKDQETQAIHVCVGMDSRIRIYQPWRVNEYGYMSSIVANLRQVEASTGLDFRQLIEADEVKLTIHITIPRIWNHTQHWSADITLYKATWFFLFAHKNFFQDFSDDWATKTLPDLLTFVPYEWTINIGLRDFEMIWLANDYNWIDCSTNCQENAEIALCGESLDLYFALPYTSFLPEREEIKFVIQVERLVGRLNIPESSTLRRSFLALAREQSRRSACSLTSATVDQDGLESADEQLLFADDTEFSGGWRRHTELSRDWVDVFSTPTLSFIISYIYHPIVCGETFECVLERHNECTQDNAESPFDLDPDIINLEVEANSCAFKLVGMLLKALANIKENYFGAYQEFREFDARSLSKMKRTITSEYGDTDNMDKEVVDKLSLRPMEANIMVNLCSIKAELTKNCSFEEGISPLLLMDRLTFEMHKSFSETRLQLQLSPTTIYAYDGVERTVANKHLGQGFLHLSGLQLRGHAMFSNEDRPVHCETLEYAWLIELQLGTLCGKISLPQLQAVYTWAELFMFHFEDEENLLQDPVPIKTCQHGVLRTKCGKESKIGENEDDPSLCPVEDDFKYKFTRISVEQVDLCLVEACCCCNVKLSSIRLATCNLHSRESELGITFLLSKVEVYQYVLLLSLNKLKTQMHITPQQASWLEAGSVNFGPVVSDVSFGESLSNVASDQKEFLEKHDRKSRRLWFLWKQVSQHGKRTSKDKRCCGCVGGCSFFGKNLNGGDFFKGGILDGTDQEKQGRGFGSPDGWQDKRDHGDNVFGDKSENMLHRHNSWAGRARSSSRLGVGSGDHRLRSETHSGGFDSNKETSNVTKSSKHLLNTGVANARSVPDSFQKMASSSSNMYDRHGKQKATRMTLSDQKERRPSDSSFYSCSSALEGNTSQTPSLMSLDSFTSAVETSDQLTYCISDDFQEQFILLPNVLLSKYKEHLTHLNCNNWFNDDIPKPNKRFDVMQNLRVIDQRQSACPARLQLTTRDRTSDGLLIKKKNGNDISVSEQATSPKVEQRMTDLRQVVLLRDSDNVDSEKLSGKMDTLKRRRWKMEINNESTKSSSSKNNKTTFAEETSLPQETSTAIVKLEGFANIMFTPLLLEAFQRYTKSVSEQVSLLHPCSILDKIHIKSIDVAMKKYKLEQLLSNGCSKKNGVTTNAFLTVPGVNICFMQAFTSECSISSILHSRNGSESDLSESSYHPNPSLSLLAIHIDKLSGQLIRCNQPHRQATDKTQIEVNVETEAKEKLLGVEHEKYGGEKRDSEMSGSFDINQVQIQFSRLSKKSDFEDSHTTAVPPKMSKVDFRYASNNVVQFSKDLDIKNLRKENFVIFIMLECGIENSSLKFGNSSLVKDTVTEKPQAVSTPKKSGHSRSQSAPAQLLTKIMHDADECDNKVNVSHGILHENYSEQVLEGIVVEKTPGCNLSPVTIVGDDSASSISSSSSRITHSDSTGELTDNESEGDDEPLLRKTGTLPMSTIEKPSATIHDVTDGRPKKPAFSLNRKNDAVVNFTCIWFNCASPSSVKPVPENYHLHNNLLTTGVPAVSSWMPGVEKMKLLFNQLQNNQQKRYYLVTAIIMAQGLPDKMLCSHTVTNKASSLSKYLQTDYSSQLILNLRRQLTGSRKQKVFNALSDTSSTPAIEDLSKGIMALSRQWKCVLGVTEEEFVFRPAGSLKRPVVGRGVLTERDRAILMSMGKQQTEKFADDQFENQNQTEITDIITAAVTPVAQQYSTSELLSNKLSSSISSISSSEEDSTLHSGKARFKRKRGLSPRNETEQSLYSWFSSPVASPRSSKNDYTIIDKSEITTPTVTWAKDPKDDDDLFGQMVSQPTSGKQIADEKVIFRAFFLGIGFLQPSDEFTGCSYETNSLLVRLKCLRLDISEGKYDFLRRKIPKIDIPVSNSTDQQIHTPSFVIKSFEAKASVADTPLCDYNNGPDQTNVIRRNKKDEIQRSVSIKVGCHTATQNINLSLIRFSLQVADMIDILGDNYRGVQGVKHSPVELASNTGSGSGASSRGDSQKCWRIMYQVSNLYSALPTENTQRLTARSKDCKIDMSGSKTDRPPLLRTVSSPKDIRFVASKSSRTLPKFKLVFVITLQKLRCITTLGELCLQTDLNSINLCISRKVEEHHGTLIKKSLLETCSRKVSTTSVSFHLQKTSLVLSETGDENGIVVSCVLNPSHGIYSCVDQKDDIKKRLLFTFGIFDVDIPQHPVALHCMMTRSSKTLSKQISELQSQRSVIRTFSSLERSSLVEISRDKVTEQAVDNTTSVTQVLKNEMDVTDNGVSQVDGKVDSNFPNMSVTVVLKGFSVGASLLPSLKVEYKIGTVISCGQTGTENVFKLDMPQHHLSFTSKVKSLDSSIPASTSIELPRVDISGTLDVIQTAGSASDKKNGSAIQSEKKHLTIVADIGTFNQHLSTDLLNHLIFIQKGFMKEVNDVLQRVSGESQPIPLWRSASTDDMDSTDKAHFLLFSFTLNLKGIEITATTPSSTAVRLETGVVNLKMSNRDIANIKSHADSEDQTKQNSKILVVAEVDLTLSLGQFFKQEQQQFMLETTDFQQLAFFKTQVRVANSSQDEGQSEEKETLLVSVFKPSVYVEPIAFDKAVLLYLNYKNAYAYWNEQRMTLTEDVQFATQAVFEKLPQRNPSGQLSGFLFLQLTVSNLGLCLPLLTLNQEQPVITALGTGEVSSAMVLTMENMLLTCCSSASFVSKGSFKHFCVRFTEKFDVKKTDWKPSSACVNSCMVPDGTYEICSRTIRQPYANDATKAGKMVMSLKWEMCGIDVHCDTDIGKPLKELGQTLTAVAGDSDIANLDSVAEETEVQIKKEYENAAHDVEEDDVFDETDSKPRFKNQQPQKLEKEMWQQARKVNELRRKPTVDVKELRTETGVLQELENAVYNEFRRDVKRKFERQSHRSLFSVTDGGRSTKTSSVPPENIKRPSTLKLPSTKRATNGLDQVDSGKSSEMISLTSSHNLVVSPRSWKAPMSDLSISSQEISGDQMHTLSPNVTPGGGPGQQTSPSPSRQYLTRPKISEHAYSTPTNTQHVSFMSQRSTTVEQDLDFDLDVMINIESGKCVFHSTPDTKIDNSDSRTYPSRTHESVRMTFSSGQRHRQKAGMKAQDDVPDSSTILLPGVEMRVHYSSATTSENFSSFTSDSSDTMTGPSLFSPGNTSADSSMGLKKTGKHASLYISLLVQPLPKEMLIRPSLLDFIDKALNPIVSSMDFDSGEQLLEDNNTPKAENDLDPTTGSFISSATSEHSSFPVDIVIVARVQPSNIRISCLPASRVECLMRIPSLDLSYSSNPSPNKTCKSYMRNQSLTYDIRNLQRSGSDNGASRYDSGGISFSICLSRFSLFIYHPYGKQHSVATKTNSLPEDNAGVSPKARVNVSQPEAVSGKKDALSLSLEFIKFNLFRRRFGDFSTSVRHEKLDEVSVESTTLVKVSALCDIGSATFTYDMRRLQEILDFPRCWHKRGLLSRLFLGKEGTYATKSANVPAADATDGSVISGITPSAPKTTTPEKLQHPLASPLGHRRSISTPLPGILPFFSSPNLFGANTHASVAKSESQRKDYPKNRDVVVDSTELDTSKRASSIAASTTSKWETIVVVGISLSRLDVSTNMANVMGKTVWSTSDLRASGNLRLTNSGERTLRSKLSIRQSTWESRGGIAGGHIELQDISSYVNMSERRGFEPEHSGNVRFRYCETRIDYMGTCILMGNLSSFRISMMDEWKTSNIKSSSTDNLLNDNESRTVVTKAKIYLRGNLHWKNVRLVICRSTTSDLIKMIHKIQAFFTQQANSSVMLLSSMSRPTDYGDVVSSLSNPLSKPVQEKHEKGSQNDGLKYQHWSKALSTISNFKSTALSHVLPEKGAVIGGSLELSGWEVILACFHGLNFRSQTWALFSISQPSATFSSKVGCVEKSCQVRRARSIQKLSFRLGGQNQSSKCNDPQEAAHMGMICKVERGRRNPPSMGSSVTEWLSYVSSVNNVSGQPSPSGDVSPPPRSKPETESTAYTPRRRNKSVSAGATYRYEHDSEAIFGLPSFQVDLTTEHDQPIRVKFSTGDKLSESWPVATSSPHIVECSLESCFYDSLYVTMDVGLLFFLHEIIQTYVKENESAATTTMSQGFQAIKDPIMTDTDINAKVSQKKKIRQFRSKCWKLEPTVRFLSWAGRRVEGVNIDWVLEKLGFSHARLTIPKWVQRGAMDPMDRFLSVLLYHLLLAVEENSKNEKK